MDRTGNQAKSITVDTRGNSTNVGYILIVVLVIGLAAGSFGFLNILSGTGNPAGYNTDITANINDDGSVDFNFNGPDDSGNITIITGEGNETTINQPGNAGGGGNETNLCDELGPFQNARIVSEDEETGDSELLDSVSFDEEKCTQNTPDPDAGGGGNVSIAIG
ncbi:hypothetical protein [Halorubrum sp. Atlit-26R]|uniref:hypothetical protein n=1 Tax=Halorubrum sp. Atlit-26R TaxID=2282128 RepID=UPI000EF2945B|nr:hypothetical protein [Halorubrum sp. Atlit-26R]RLM68601.1 hypothetical protein DVK07_10800 [Halorubrum sp. Atlit-26R]